MVFLAEDPKGSRPFARFLPSGVTPSWADLVAFVLLAGVGLLVAYGLRKMGQPLAELKVAPVTLDIARLPEYAALTTLRMFAALFFSMLFTFTVAPLAAKSRKAEMIIIPAIDIAQSVPVLGFLTFTTVFFMGLFPGQQMGLECAAIFAIFTSQAWNIAFSFYQSLRTLPKDLQEVATAFNFSPWQKFIRLELPFAIPGLVWNVMISMSGSWFFVVASEVITVGDKSVGLPGIGSYLGVAIEQKSLSGVMWAVLAMVVVILIYDQLIFRPIVAWADKFRFEQTPSGVVPKSWFYDLLRQAKAMRMMSRPLEKRIETLKKVKWPRLPKLKLPKVSPLMGRVFDGLWYILMAVLVIGSSILLYEFISKALSLDEILKVFGYGMITLLRVVILMVICTVIWVPIGIWIGLDPVLTERFQPLVQFLASFPANVLFPVMVVLIAHFKLDPNIWLSPLIILGTQWYLLFNVIAGASSLSGDLKECTKVFGIKGLTWWRRVLIPTVLPYYVTGALTATGGSWNASILAELVSWGDTKYKALGLGSYIAEASAVTDYPKVALGIAVMVILVLLLNRIMWQPLSDYVERRFSVN